MALIQTNGACRVLSASGNTKNKSKSGQFGNKIPSGTERASSAECGHSTAAPTMIHPPKKQKKGTAVAPRSTQLVYGIDGDGQSWEVKYYSKTYDALQGIICLHGLHHLLENLKPDNELDLTYTASLLGIKSFEIWNITKGKITLSLHEEEIEEKNPCLSKLMILNFHSDLKIIKSVDKVYKCPDCGRFFKSSHSCNVRRRNFYFHNINKQSADWWESISFFPIGSHPETERLYITYDIETYTWHGHCGKQLIPFMLVFSITGSHKMQQTAARIATEQGWTEWKRDSDNVPIFYCLNPQKRLIGHKFKTYRHQLQLRFTQDLWQHFLHENPDVAQAAVERFNLPSPDDLTPSMLKQLKIQGRPKFVEVYIIGHNINGFDEIVIAAQVIQNKTDVCNAFTVTRNFMPRNGKILFNDITFALPNPTYQARKDFSLWEEGGCDDSDFRHQFVKFMVRDTFALTHTSLRNAAKAYNLSVEKGSCPYLAVNEFYMKGTYRVDDDGFPHESYWKDKAEYEENKLLWIKENAPYDIVKKTLEYCIQDVKVTYKLVQKLCDSYSQFIREDVKLPLSHFNILQRPTISSNSHAIFRQILYKQVKTQKTNMGTAILAPSKEMYEYVRQSIRGGRCYPTFIGVLTEPIYVYDICGMYASALTHPFPSGQPLAPYDRNIAIIQWQNKLNNPSQIDYFNTELLPGIFTIDADPPSEEWTDTLPPFCSRKGGRLTWTNESLRGEICTSIDMITLHNRKWKLRIIPDERCTIFPEWKCLCKDYVQLNIKAKEKADAAKNQTVRSIAKLLSNALYGSFATKLDNKKIVFGDQLLESAKDIASGKVSIKSTSFIETDDFSAEILPEFSVTYSACHNGAPPENTETRENSDSEEDTRLNTSSDHAHSYNVTYKPITFLEADDEQLCLHTLEKNSDIIENNRYPSQIASFVLAWTRAFVSEWATFLFEEDYGKAIEDRPLKAVYGDTDSLFLTKEGRRLMETRGRKRLKKNGGRLVFDELNPDLTWLVECETICQKCGGDAYSTESVFLAPKLYALKNTFCDSCQYEGKGKLRAKGHATDGLDYDTLVACYLSDSQQGTEKFATSRMSLKRTLASAQSHAHPFTVTEATLMRTLRPWKDMTLVYIDQHRLTPYSNRNPNPRNQESCLMELPWNM
ncbi:DNApol [red squirrel adenovirus 1]|uniref:DNA polymerase n=3 Tax=Mastadenovirus TaxID=10509 RepID=A0A240FBG0_9ADEN|nr:DNApol [red squirrel adenovirus 1]ARE31880.1 DNApol [red squirrel adenovirus 1]WUG45421.1 pol [Squirrel mastadenovirus A]